MVFGKCKIIFTLTFISSVALGQGLEKLEKRAQKLFYTEELSEAADVYQEILDVDAKHRIATYRLQICKLLLSPGQSSIDDLLQYKSTQGKRDKFYYYWLGRAYFLQNQFRKAIESWNKFLTVDKYKSSIIIEETQYFLDWAARAETHHSFPENYEIEQLPSPINSTATEYSPVYFNEKKELLFLSSRESTTTDQPFSIYHSIQKEGQWSAPSVLSQFGNFQQDNANIEVVNNSSKLYLYRGDKKGQLFVSTGSGNKWGVPKSLDREVSSSKLESHFFINEQENKILFAHRKKGNTADLDIYESHLNPANNKWTKPAPLSPVLTSETDEDYPYLSEDGNTLYFSSRGFGSIGGYDVFKSEFDPSNQTWSAPQSLGYPTNSIADDIHFKIDPLTNSGYFVSDRLSAMGSFDIYFFHASDKVLLAGTVVDGSGLPAENVEIHFYPARTTGLELKTMTDAEGKYEVKVGSSDKIKVEILFHDELVHRESIQTPAAKVTGTRIRKNFLIDKEKVPVEDIVHNPDPEFSDLENIGSKFRASNKALISNIYFGFEQIDLRDAEIPKLEPLLNAMKENPELHIEIAGHTDDIGDGMTNLRISILRARSVARYLTEQGISENRVVAKGYGYAIPLATNDQEREGRELNRRIEVLVIE
ncbi:MAG: OmpA family protein [Reichenbachiella sp.]|uniref:OmpA family protein n=1 Tax=Reichenbachiella sp. TaxID=2184521 RepID=UPI003264AECD